VEDWDDEPAQDGGADFAEQDAHAWGAGAGAGEEAGSAWEAAVTALAAERARLADAADALRARIEAGLPDELRALVRVAIGEESEGGEGAGEAGGSGSGEGGEGAERDGDVEAGARAVEAALDDDLARGAADDDKRVHALWVTGGAAPQGGGGSDGSGSEGDAGDAGGAPPPPAAALPPDA
jgi:hypothetical protein